MEKPSWRGDILRRKKRGLAPWETTRVRGRNAVVVASCTIFILKALVCPPKKLFFRLKNILENIKRFDKIHVL